MQRKRDSKTPSVAKTNKGMLITLSRFAVCDIIKLRFIKDEEACLLLSSLGIKRPLSKIPLVGRLLF